MKIQLSKVAAFGFIGVCIVFGQNCGKKSYDFVDEKGKLVTSASTEYQEQVFVEDDLTAELPPEEEMVPEEQEEVICDPLKDASNCEEAVVYRRGLRGNLYSLTQDQLPNKDIGQSTIDDHIMYGSKLPADIIMSSIDVPTRNWEKGFQVEGQAPFKDANGRILNEYFALDLYGYLSFPEASEMKMIEFAAISDDGIRVFIDGVSVLNDDFKHAPRWACGGKVVSFMPGEKRQIHLQYYQGPRTQIALQLFYREVDSSSGECNSQGGWKLFGESSFAH